MESNYSSEITKKHIIDFADDIINSIAPPDRFYLSGKITGLNLQSAKVEFCEAEKVVLDNYIGATTTNPFDVKPLLGIKKWFFYMVKCLLAQKKCNKTAMLSNWKDSKGAVIEYFFAKFIYKQEVLFVDEIRNVLK